MKTHIIIAAVALFVLGAHAAGAQSKDQMQRTEQAIRKDGKYALLVMKAQHLKVAIMTGKELKAGSPGIDFQIVTCGELVKEIAGDTALGNMVRRAVNNDGMKIVICGISVRQFKVDEALLPVEAPITGNGLIYMFGLQEQSYKTIIL